MNLVISFVVFLLSRLFLVFAVDWAVWIWPHRVSLACIVDLGDGSLLSDFSPSGCNWLTRVH